MLGIPALSAETYQANGSSGREGCRKGDCAQNAPSFKENPSAEAQMGDAYRAPEGRTVGVAVKRPDEVSRRAETAAPRPCPLAAART